jgi:hypothetical protein
MPATSPRFQLDVLVPCQVPWGTMAGDERVRFCSRCRQNVYHLSEMSRAEAEDLLRAKEGRLCVRFYRRPDGTVLTRDCVSALRVWRRVMAACVAVAAAFVLAFLGWVDGFLGGQGNGTCGTRNPGPLQMILDWVNPAPPPVMGEAPPLPPAPVPPQAVPGAPQPDAGHEQPPG